MFTYINENRIIYFILIFGFILRILVNNIVDLPQFIDVSAYEKAGYEIINNFQIKKHIVMPLYAIFVYLNKNFFDLTFFNIIISTTNIYLVYSLTQKIFKELSISVISSLIMAVYPFNIFYALSGFSETFFITLILFGFNFLLKKKFIISYIFFVLSILARPLGDLIFPFIIIYFCIFVFKLDKKNIIINLIKYLLIYVLLMSPWWYHNFIKYDKFVRLNLSLNYMLYVGNNENNKSGGGVVIDEDDIRKFPERFKNVHSDYDFEIFKNRPGFEDKVDYVDENGDVFSFSVGYNLNQVDPNLAKDLSNVRRREGLENFILRNDQFKIEALNFIKNNPQTFIKNAFIKFQRFWSPIPFSQEFRSNFIYTSISFISVSFLFFFSFLGIFLKSNWKNINLIPFYIFIIYTTGIHMVLVSSIRYRFVIEWILIILAAYSLNFFLKKMIKIK